MRAALLPIALGLTGMAAGSVPAATPRIAIVNCDDATRAIAQPGGTLYGARLGLSWGSRARKLEPARNAKFPFSSKLPIFVRGGGGSFTIAVAPGWHERAGMAWDARGDAKPRIAHGVRVVPCPGGDSDASVWLAYSGAFYVERPACLPIVIAMGARRYTARVPLGRACP